MTSIRRAARIGAIVALLGLSFNEGAVASSTLEGHYKGKGETGTANAQIFTVRFDVTGRDVVKHVKVDNYALTCNADQDYYGYPHMDLRGSDKVNQKLKFSITDTQNIQLLGPTKVTVKGHFIKLGSEVEGSITVVQVGQYCQATDYWTTE